MPAGRPPKLTKEDRYQVYAYHLAGLTVWEIAKKFDCTERTIYNALDWTRDQIPKFDRKQNLLDSIHSIREMIKDLNIRKQLIVHQAEKECKVMGEMGTTGGKGDKNGTDHQKVYRSYWVNGYIGVMRQLRECHALLHKLLGLEKMTLEIGGETIKGLHDILEGKWRPKLPENLPENARRSISGEGMEEEWADHTM